MRNALGLLYLKITVSMTLTLFFFFSIALKSGLNSASLAHWIENKILTFLSLEFLQVLSLLLLRHTECTRILDLKLYIPEINAEFHKIKYWIQHTHNPLQDNRFRTGCLQRSCFTGVYFQLISVLITMFEDCYFLYS